MWLAEKTVWPYRFRQGRSALIVSMPHVGTFVPRSVGRELGDCAALRSDTDWHLPRLYDFLEDLDATVIAANYSRYVIDVNRPPDGANLYPGRDTPKLCPTDTFSGEPLYRQGEPGPDEIARRLAVVWQPYHARLDREIARVREIHGRVVLWDAHSIVSVEPRLFEGRLPDFNLGTADGASCDPLLAEKLVSALKQHSRYTAVLNGRFKGGYITRRYGDPAGGVQAIQLEMVMANYMGEKPPFGFREDLAQPVRAILRELLRIAAAYPATSTGSEARPLLR
jgi:N-formylglutamate deformylase